MDENASLTPQEVADLLKISKNTVYEMIKRGDINGYRVGNKMRVDERDVEQYKNKTRSHGAVRLFAPNTPVMDFDCSPAWAKTSGDFVICGQDVILDILAQRLEKQITGLRVLRSYLGSYNGLFALYRGEVQIATAHLWDADTNSYNLPYIRRMLPGTPTTVYHLAKRMEGFFVAKGNPKGIKNWDDLKRGDISIINREKGSGARVLLDEHLRGIAIDGRDIKGYARECTSHITVASTIARGGADLGIGIEKVSRQVQNIDFIPLQEENLDLVIKKEDENKPLFQKVIQMICSKELSGELESIGGYNLSEMGRLMGNT